MLILEMNPIRTVSNRIEVYVIVSDEWYESFTRNTLFLRYHLQVKVYLIVKVKWVQNSPLNSPLIRNPDGSRYCI